MDDAVLDNPVWWASTGADRTHTVGGELARRFPPEMSPFAAVADPSDPAAWAELRALAASAPVAVIAPEAPADWVELRALPLDQMVFDGPPDPLRVPIEFTPLTQADAADMLELATRTEPGPFGPATVAFGGCRGLRVDGALVCMAGERMHPGDWTEISAVCTDPDFRGRGLAAALVASLVNEIRAAGRHPYLNVAVDNPVARRVYERLGFRERASIVVRVLEPAPIGAAAR